MIQERNVHKLFKLLALLGVVLSLSGKIQGLSTKVARNASIRAISSTSPSSAILLTTKNATTSYSWDITLAALYDSRGYLCAATMLDQKHFITAASCFLGTGRGWGLHVGPIAQNESVSRAHSVPVSQFFPHANFNARLGLNDLVIMRIGRPISFDRNNRAMGRTYIGQAARTGLKSDKLVGAFWKPDSETGKMRMSKLVFSLLSRQKCLTKLWPNAQTDEEQRLLVEHFIEQQPICARGTRMTPGSPLFRANGNERQSELLGVASLASLGNQEETLFTSIPMSRRWIDRVKRARELS